MTGTRGISASTETTPGGTAPEPAPDHRPTDAGGTRDPAQTVTPSDPRYPDLVVGNNQRWVAAPDAVRLAGTPHQVLRAVQDAVDAGKRISVRSGGHCYADFVYSSSTKIIIDLSQMSQVGYDPARSAFFVEPGAILMRVYEALKKRWNVTLPAGVCLAVGIGGHAAGGGYGLLSRQHGIVADHLAAVEMVVVDRSGTARLVVATRNPSDPNHDLWWAAAGGGGGNFGIVTRYWFRSPGATGDDPACQLPRAPGDVILSFIPVPWAALDQHTFTTLIRNFGTWYAQHADPDSPYTALSGAALLAHRSAGSITLLAQVDAAAPNAVRLLDDYLAAVTKDTGIVAPFPPTRLHWLAATRVIGTSDPATTLNPTKRSAVKSAYMRRGFTDAQIAAIYANLTRTDYANPTATLQINGVAGGKVNARPPTAVAYPHRSAAFLALFENFWDNPAEDAQHVGWLRDLYGQTFAATGGYPVPNEQTDGCYINSPDMDIRDPDINRSGVPWSTLYYKENYPRLQQVKARWDPTNVFRHAQSIELP